MAKKSFSEKFKDHKSETVVDYWMKYYAVGHHCNLCGNWGFFDTRDIAYTPAGVHVGRKMYCICPNGQALRSQNDNRDIV